MSSSLFQALGSRERKKGEREKKWGKTKARKPLLALVLPRFFSLVFACPQLPRAWNRLDVKWQPLLLICFYTNELNFNSLDLTITILLDKFSISL